MPPARSLLVAACVLACVHLVFAAPTIRLVEDDADVTDEMTPAGLTALQTYVAQPDANFAWAYHQEFDMQGDGYKVMWLNMTSQRWLTDADVSKSLWQHWVAVIVPNTLNPDFASNSLLWIGGGHNDVAKPPTIWDKDLIVVAAMAQEIGTIVVSCYAVPNQPMQYWSESPTPKSRTEDAMIAFAWAHYINDPSNAEWLPRLPMTKAAIRAMDAASAFWKQESGFELSAWLVAGASKRGWTTWTVGICDQPRVIGIVPMVLDELNFVANIKHHYRAYGGWSFALTDYWSLNFTAELDNPNVASMMSIVDPINYVDILANIPKMVISTGGDEFLLPDNVDYWWSQMQGEKHFHIFPNLEHTMIENIPAIVETVRGFALQVMTATPRPSYVWTKTDNGTIHLELDAATPPSSVKVWAATTIDGNTRRDFRLVAIMPPTSPSPKPPAPGLHPVWWYESSIEPTSTTPSLITYDAYVAPPAEGWVAFVIEVEWPVANAVNATFRVSSAPSILPQTFPYPECQGEGCLGVLV